MTVMVEAATALRWVPAGERVVVGQRRLDAGAVYVGEGSDEPSAIDPTLPVDRAQPDWGAASVREKRYAALTPQARAAYLVWLETGRRARQAPSAWASLYLYGLERRILVDGDRDPVLRREVQELDAVYGHDAEVHRIAVGPYPTPQLPELMDSLSVPDALRIELGRRALASTPVDADWALAWAWFHPAIPRREAALRATEVFAQRWKQAFAEEHPQGLVVAPRRRRLTLEYTPGNPSLPGPIEVRVDHASDVFDAPGPEQVLRAITERVESELETHVQWRRRNPDGNAHASGTLPHSLVDDEPPVVAWARARLGDREWQRIEGLDGDPLALARTLDQFGIGIEPDVRFGGPPPTGEAVLFRFERPPVTSPSPAYATALVTLELCAAVAAADGPESDAEDALLVEQVGRVEGLLDAERARLAAHRELLRSTGTDIENAAQRIDADQRERLGAYLLEVARVDGEISEAERRTFEKIHALLGLPAPDLDVTETLDRKRLERTRASNTEVQELLATIFADEEEEEEEEEAQQPPHESIAGLDPRHSALLRELAATGTWSRTELEAGAREHGVMPDGALEIINEAALDATGEPVVEIDDDSVTIDPDVYQGMPA